MRPSWLKISAILACLWLVVGGLLWFLESRRPSPEKLVAYAEKHRVGGKPDTERMEIVEAVAAGYHKLDMDARRELLISQGLKTWWTDLTRPERFSLRMLLFPQSRQVVEFFDSLSPEERERNLQKLMADVRKLGGEGMMPQVGTRAISMAKSFGVKAFFEGPMLDEKIDSLLMMHEFERRIVWRRR